MSTFTVIRLKIGIVVAVVIAGHSLSLSNLFAQERSEWQPFTLSVFNKHINESKIVVVFIYADWSPESKNTKEILFSPHVRKVLSSYSVTLMYLDYTDPDSLDKNILEFFGSLNMQYQVPLVAICAKWAKPIVLVGYPIMIKRVTSSISRIRRSLKCR